MDYLKRYEKRLVLSGNSATEALINQSFKSYEREFHTSPSFYQVDIDGNTVDTIINTTSNFDEKKINFRPSYSPIVGSIVTFKADKYLLMEKDQNEIYRFGLMKRCNHTIDIQLDGEKQFVGYDKDSKPIYEIIADTLEIPCIITSKYYSSNDNAQLPLPEGRISLFMRYYPTNNNIEVGEEFILFEKRYIIADIDLTRVEGSDGIVEVVLERKVSQK